MVKAVFWLLALFVAGVFSWPYDPSEVDYNLNTNQLAQNPLEYTGKWDGHNYTASPENWRFPFYTLFLDRFVNGDPTNDDINGTVFENDVMSTNFRFGRDLAGLTDSLDYLQGMGIVGLYIAGTPYLNRPWKYDQYSPLDLTILDHHSGTIKEWQAFVNEVHSRGMYIMLDLTSSTMADLIGVKDYLNETAPFNPEEYDVLWKTDRRYSDFTFNNVRKDSCEYPRFWNESGKRVLKDAAQRPEEVDKEFTRLVGCYDSEFDQYGDTEAFGVFADWQRQLSKFASVQDRIVCENGVEEKISHFNCLLIAQLNIDAVRFDKATQMTMDPLASLAANLRTCARKHGKENFFISGEITGGDRFGSIYLGRGREFHTYPEVVVPTDYSNNSLFLRNETSQGLDAAAFHYSIRRTLTRILGLDGPSLANGYDLPTNFVDSWNTMTKSNDFINANTGKLDPRHMYGVTNQDVFRWPAIKGGTDRMLRGLFIVTLHMPGIPLLLWGEEQSLYLLADTMAVNYMFGRQPMSSAMAWQLHGCFGLNTNSSSYYQLPLDAALKGCEDQLVGQDHRDPTHPIHNQIKAMHALRKNYPVLQDGFNLQRLSNQTFNMTLPGSNNTPTETGMWSTVRNQMSGLQQLSSGNQSVWLVYHNQDHGVTYKFDCKKNETALLSAFPEGTTVKNLLAPYEELELQDGPNIKLFIDGSQELNGCLDELKLDPWGFKAFVPKSAWVKPDPMLTEFVPGHDARLPSASTLDVELHFSEKMNCDEITDSITITSTTDSQKVPMIASGSVLCSGLTRRAEVPGYGAYIPSVWIWKATLTGIEDGIHTMTLRSKSATNDRDLVDHLMFRIGQPENPMVYPQTANYSRAAYSKDQAIGDLIVSHQAPGVDKWRYSTNFGSSWSPWHNYEGGNLTIEKLPWKGTKRQAWSGEHIMLQYWSKKAGSNAHMQHADADWSEKPPRWFPNLFAQGPYNQFGYDSGLPSLLRSAASDGLSRFHFMAELPTTLQLSVWEGISTESLTKASSSAMQTTTPFSIE